MTTSLSHFSLTPFSPSISLYSFTTSQLCFTLCCIYINTITSLRIKKYYLPSVYRTNDLRISSDLLSITLFSRPHCSIQESPVSFFYLFFPWSQTHLGQNLIYAKCAHAHLYENGTRSLKAKKAMESVLFCVTKVTVYEKLDALKGSKKK